MKRKRTLALIMACTLLFQSFSVSAANISPTQVPSEQTITEIDPSDDTEVAPSDTEANNNNESTDGTVDETSEDSMKTLNSKKLEDENVEKTLTTTTANENVKATFSEPTTYSNDQLTVTIPDSCTLNYNKTTSNFEYNGSVSAKGKVQSNQKLTISSDTSLSFENQDDSTVKVSGKAGFGDNVTNSSEEWTATQLSNSIQTLDSRKYGISVKKEDITYTGDYQTPVTFNINLETKEIPVTDYYTYTLDSTTNGYKVGLSGKFKTQVKKDTGGSFTDTNGNTWITGEPLPNPGNIYNGIPVTNLSYMFYNYGYVQTLDLSNFDTSNVTDMNNMFIYCRNLQTLNISNFDTSNVTNMEYMFSYCSLQTLDLSNFDTGNVTSMKGMFTGWSSQTLDLSNFDTSNVIDMSGMFSTATLQTLNINNFNMNKVINTDAMFAYCGSLTSLVSIPNWGTKAPDSYRNMFLECPLDAKYKPSWAQ